MAATRGLAPNIGEVPERLIGARWKRDGRSDAAREFEPRPLLQFRMPSSGVEQSVDNAQVIGSIPMASTTTVTANVPRLASWSPKPTGKVRFLGWSPNMEVCRSPAKRACLENSAAAGPRAFESLRFRHNKLDVAQLEERPATNGEAKGSNPFFEARTRSNWRCGRAAEGAFLLRKKRWPTPALDGSNPSISANTMSFAFLAQLVEQCPYKAKVGGSIPSERTRIPKGCDDS